jgi:hypothetical protein
MEQLQSSGGLQQEHSSNLSCLSRAQCAITVRSQLHNVLCTKILPFSPLRIKGAIVPEILDELRVLAVVPAGMQSEIRRQLTSLAVIPVLVSNAAELAHVVRGEEVYQVTLLPAALPHSDWWAIWGELALLNPRPAILVYAQTASFQLWSGVLEAGGYDVIVEPLTDEKLKEAVLRAAESFAERSLENPEQE